MCSDYFLYFHLHYRQRRNIMVMLFLNFDYQVLGVKLFCVAVITFISHKRKLDNEKSVWVTTNHFLVIQLLWWCRHYFPFAQEKIGQLKLCLGCNIFWVFQLLWYCCLAQEKVGQSKTSVWVTINDSRRTNVRLSVCLKSKSLNSINSIIPPHNSAT